MLFDQLVINDKVYWAAEEIKKFYEPQRDEIQSLKKEIEKLRLEKESFQDALSDAFDEAKMLRYRLSDMREAVEGMKEIVSNEFDVCKCDCWSCNIG